MIGVIDYGLGNVQAFLNVYERLGISVFAVKTKPDFDRATRLILPGVGSFDWAINALNNSGLREPLDDYVIRRGMPILGVCVGMQIMACSSKEGESDGMGWIETEVEQFDKNNVCQAKPVPHMGWNDVSPINCEGLFEGSDTFPRFYFLHSYYFALLKEETLAKSCYGIEFSSAVHTNNIYGVQFHPEKSHGWGLQLLQNYSKL
tara:strand:- start:2446 stop:3057 length:612 start_codon:yes stop_codon:yes gene_type:complete